MLMVGVCNGIWCAETLNVGSAEVIETTGVP